MWNFHVFLFFKKALPKEQPMEIRTIPCESQDYARALRTTRFPAIQFQKIVAPPEPPLLQ